MFQVSMLAPSPDDTNTWPSPRFSPANPTQLPVNVPHVASQFCPDVMATSMDEKKVVL